MDQAQRTTRAKIAADISWAKCSDRSRRTAPAREASMARFEREVDPNGVMSPQARALAADSARRAYFRRLALASHAARRAKRAG
ncbi:hypothetical protein [Saccharothrix stipae]